MSAHGGTMTSESSDLRGPDAPMLNRAVAPRKVLPAWAAFVTAGLAFWVVGFLPWIVSGMHLDQSSAWSFYRIENPVVALPFGEYRFPHLLVGAVVGGGAALAVALLARPEVRRPRLLAAAGLVVTFAVALGQTLLVVRSGLEPRIEARALLVGLVVAAVGFALVGLVAGLLVASGRGWGWLLGGATIASVLGFWVGMMSESLGPATGGAVAGVARSAPWVTGAALGVVLAVFGLRPAARLVGWVLALAIAWLAQPAMNALVYGTNLGTRGSATGADLREAADAARDVFVQSLGLDAHPLGPYALALVVGGIGAVVLDQRRDRVLTRASDRPS